MSKVESPNTLGLADGNAGIRLIFTPIRLFQSILSAVLTTLRPYSTQVVPIVVCTFFVPLALVLSAFAGYVVWNNLSISWESPLHLQYGDGVSPYANVFVEVLHPRQRYDVSLNLLVPATPDNLDLGNFMATLTLSSMNNKTLISVRRPAIVIPSRSRLFYMKSTIVNVQVPLLTSFVAGTSKLIADIEIGRRDSWKTLGSGQGRELSVISASLRGLSVPHGIRGLAIRFPLVSALFSAFTFLAILSLMLGICILPAMIPSTPDFREGESPPSNKVESTWTRSSTYDSDNKHRRRRKSRLSTNTGGHAVKAEAPIAAIPSSEASPSERLRRRQSTSRDKNETDSDH